METVKAPDSHPEIILERLIQENQVSLKRLCYLYLHYEDMAEDAVQETFLKMYQSLSDYRGEANERTYLTRIAINTCKDMLRSGWFRHIDRRITVDALPRSEEIKDSQALAFLVQYYSCIRALLCLASGAGWVWEV